MKICGACIMNIFNCPSNVDIIIRIYPITQTVNIINMVMLQTSLIRMKNMALQGARLGPNSPALNEQTVS